MTSVLDGKTDMETTYEFDPAGRVTVQAHPNGATSYFAYDLAGRLAEKVTQKDSDGSVLVRFGYTRDAAGIRNTWVRRRLPSEPTSGAPRPKSTWASTRLSLKVAGFEVFGRGRFWVTDDTGTRRSRRPTWPATRRLTWPLCRAAAGLLKPWPLPTRSADRWARLTGRRCIGRRAGEALALWTCLRRTSAKSTPRIHGGVPPCSTPAS
jgi:YD repeat-containing protein